jgi:hypothetical protein
MIINNQVYIRPMMKLPVYQKPRVQAITPSVLLTQPTAAFDGKLLILPISFLYSSFIYFLSISFFFYLLLFSYFFPLSYLLYVPISFLYSHVLLIFLHFPLFLSYLLTFFPIYSCVPISFLYSHVLLMFLFPSFLSLFFFYSFFF